MDKFAAQVKLNHFLKEWKNKREKCQWYLEPSFEHKKYMKNLKCWRTKLINWLFFKKIHQKTWGERWSDLTKL